METKKSERKHKFLCFHRPNHNVCLQRLPVRTPSPSCSSSHTTELSFSLCYCISKCKHLILLSKMHVWCSHISVIRTLSRMLGWLSNIVQEISTAETSNRSDQHVRYLKLMSERSKFSRFHIHFTLVAGCEGDSSIR